MAEDGVKFYDFYGCEIILFHYKFTSAADAAAPYSTLAVGHVIAHVYRFTYVGNLVGRR